MAQNTAKVYAPAALEVFGLNSITQPYCTAKYDWTGAKTVVVTTNSTVALSDYSRSGLARFGTPAELDNTQDELTITKDRAFTYTIDRRGREEAALTNDAGASLARQIRLQVVPEIDKYRIATIAGAAPVGNVKKAVLDKTNVYASFLELQGVLDDALVPQTGRVCWAVPAALNLLKQDPAFIKASELAQDMLIRGQLGEVDGVAIVKAPTSYLPTNDAFVAYHPDVVAAPIDLADYRTHMDPPGISGWLVEGRVVYDCFVFDALVNGIAVHQNVAA